MPNTAANAAKRIVVSKVGTMKAGTLLKGLPPTFSGYSMTEVQ